MMQAKTVKMIPLLSTGFLSAQPAIKAAPTPIAQSLILDPVLLA